MSLVTDHSPAILDHDAAPSDQDPRPETWIWSLVESLAYAGAAFDPAAALAARRLARIRLLRYLGQARQALTEPFDARGRRRERVDAAARAAADFHTWRALAPLGDADAAELAAGLIELAANPDTAR
jgi:hypothetical protein